MEVFSEDKDIVALRNEVDRLTRALESHAHALGKKIDAQSAKLDALHALIPLAERAGKLLDNPATRFLRGQNRGA